MASGGGTSANTVSSYDARDNRMAADGRAIVTRGDNVSINTTSPEAWQFGIRMADEANEVADRALIEGGRMAGDAMNMSKSVAREGMDLGRRVSGDAMSLSRNVAREGMELGARVTREGLDFAGGGLKLAERMVLKGSEAAADNLEHSLSFSNRAQDKAYLFAKDALTASRRNTETALTQISSAFGQTLAEKREDSTQLSQQLIRLGIPAVALVMIAGSFRK